MEKTLVAYFSASGKTKALATRICDVLNAELLEIEPKVHYTKEDLDWRDPNSRSSVEMKDPSYFPEFIEELSTLEDYSIIYLGFPIWWYTAPTIIHSFLKHYPMDSKKIVVFATSGGSKMGDTIQNIQPYAPGAKIIDGGVLAPSMNKEQIIDWLQQLEG